MDPSKKLVVPEINADVLTEDDKIIANPNCSTIQMVVALKPLHEKYKIKRMWCQYLSECNRYRCKSGNQLMNEARR